MPANSIRAGGTHVDVGVNTLPYIRGLRGLNAANATAGASFGNLAVAADRFANSVRSSLIATAAYTAGIGALHRVLVGSYQDFLRYEKRMVGVRKTTDASDEAMERLGDGINRIATEMSSFGTHIGVPLDQLRHVAEIAGQMNIHGVPDILAFVEAAGGLGATTDLSATEAANALGILITNTKTLAEEAPRVASVITALGNRFRGGERDILRMANEIARSTAVMDLSAEHVLALSATLAQSGVRFEQSGTVIQRSLRALNNAVVLAIQGDRTRLDALLRPLAEDAEKVNEDIDEFIENWRTGSQEIRFEGLRLLGESLLAGGPDRQRGLITTLFGGEEEPVRIVNVTGTLAKNFDEFRRAIGLAEKEMRKAEATSKELGNQNKSSGERLADVGRELQIQGEAFGEFLDPLIVFVAESYKAIETGILGVGAALLTGFGRRRVREYRQGIQQVQIDAAKDVRAAERHLERSYNLQRSAARRLADAQAADLDAQRRYASATQRFQAASAERLATRQRLERLGVAPGVISHSAVVRRAQADAQAAEQEFVAAGTSRHAIQQQNLLIRRQLTEAEERGANATQNIVDKTNLLRAAQERNIRVQRLATRVMYGLRRAVDFLGGPIGLVLGLLTLGAAAWGLYWDSTQDNGALEDSIVALEKQTEALRRQAKGALESNKAFEAVSEAYEKAAKALEDIERQIGGLPFGQRILTGLGEIEELERFIENLESAEDFDLKAIREAEGELRRIKDTVSLLLSTLPGSVFSLLGDREDAIAERDRLAALIKDFEDARDLLLNVEDREPGPLVLDYNRVNLELDKVDADIRRFFEQLDDRVRDRELRIDFGLDDVGISDLERRTREIYRGRYLEEEKAIRDSERLVRDQSEKVARLEQRRIDQIAERNRLDHGTIPREDADKRLRQIEASLIREQDRLGYAHAYLAELIRQSKVRDAMLQKESEAEAISAQTLDDARALSDIRQQALVPNVPELSAAEKYIASLNERYEIERRTEDNLVGLHDRAASRLRVRQELEGRVTEELVKRDQEIVLGQRLLERRQRDLIRVEEDLEIASGTKRDTLRAYREELLTATLALEKDNIENREALEIFRSALPVYDQLIEKISALAETGPFDNLVKEADGFLNIIGTVNDGVAEFVEEFAYYLEGTLTEAVRNFSKVFADALLDGRLRAEDLLNLLEDITRKVLTDIIQTATTKLAESAVSSIAGFFGIGGDSDVTGAAALQSSALSLNASAFSLTTAGTTLTGAGAALSAAAGALSASAAASSFGIALFHKGKAPHEHPHRVPRSLANPLRPGEHFAILLDDEEVLTRHDPRHRWNLGAWVNRLPKYHQGGVVGGGGGSAGHGETTNVTIMVRNPRTGETRQQSQQSYIGLRDLMVQIESEDLGRGGPLTQIHRQQSRM